MADQNREWEEFAKNGTQYYTAGRYATFAALMPVAGNLLHHAIEMFLKAALSKRAGTSLADLKNKLGHDLSKIWSAFKTSANDPSLAQFDPLIAAIDRFEDIRYPDAVLAEGAEISIGVGKRPSTPTQRSSTSLPFYEFWLGEVDQLIARILSVASINPKAFMGALMQPVARQYLKEHNDEATLTAGAPP